MMDENFSPPGEKTALERRVAMGLDDPAQDPEVNEVNLDEFMVDDDSGNESDGE